MKKNEILFVDDQLDIVKAFERQFRKIFSVRTAQSAVQALEILDSDGPFSVIVTDMRMPGMDGVQLLARVKELYPDMVRIMLTGDSDLKTAIEAVNSGQIFRFLSKPCSPKALTETLEQALTQYNLITAEKELLNQTLKGSVNVLCELLSLANPTAFSRGYRVKDTVVEVARKLGLERLWQYEIAALMSQIGCMTIPDDILKKIQSGSDLTAKEAKMYMNHPKIGAKLITKIPRLGHVAKMIEYQLLSYEQFVYEKNRLLTDEEQIGAQILKAAIDHDFRLIQGESHKVAIQKMSREQGTYNLEILEIISEIQIKHERVKILTLNFEDVLPGMIADEDILARNGALVIPRGQEITWSVIQELTNYLEHIGIKDPIRVRTYES
jgi:CheY-like chemotaxis protein